MNDEVSRRSSLVLICCVVRSLFDKSFDRGMSLLFLTQLLKKELEDLKVTLFFSLSPDQVI